MAGVIEWLELNGFNRASTVREPGEYAVRGGIVDLFAPGIDAPVRLDFFGDTLETIRSFDPETQRTTAELRALDLVPMAEFQLTPETIRPFRTGYVAAFGAASPDDMLYEAVSEGRRSPASSIGCRCFTRRWRRCSIIWTRRHRRGVRRSTIEPLAEEAAHERLAQIADYYQARKDVLDQAARAAARRISRCRRTGFISPKTNGARGWMRAALARLSPFAADDGTPTRSTSAPTPATTFPPSGASPAPTCSRR